MEAQCGAAKTALYQTLHAFRRARNMAMVWPVGSLIFKHLRWNFYHLPGCAHGSGDHQSKRCYCRRTRGYYFDCKRTRALSLGMAFRPYRAAMGVSADVLDTGGDLLDPAKSEQLSDVYNSGVLNTALLRRRIWNHAGFRGGLFRPRKCGISVWLDADSLGICRPGRSHLDSPYPP